MLAEWHITPDYIANNWTDELLDLMVEKLVERKKQENQATKGKPEYSQPDDVIRQFDNLRTMGSKVKVVKK